MDVVEVPRALGEGATSEGRQGGTGARDAVGDELETLYLALVRNYYEPILRYVHGMVLNEQEAEDVTQDAFLKAYMALPTGGVPDNPRAWLYRIATNTTVDHLRRRRRGGTVGLHRLLHVLRGRDRMAAVEDAEPIDRALKAVGPEPRALLLLFAEVGMKAPEVAEVLGITPAAARKRRQRAREAFTRAYREVTREL